MSFGSKILFLLSLLGMNIVCADELNFQLETSFGEGREKKFQHVLSPTLTLDLDPDIKAMYDRNHAPLDCELVLPDFKPETWRENLAAFGQQDCFENRMVSAADRDDGIWENRKQINKESMVCDCLKKHPLNQAAWEELEAKSKKSAGEIFLKDVNSNVERHVQWINDEFSAMMLQANSLVDPALSNNRKAVKAARKERVHFVGEFAQSLKNVTPAIEEGKKQFKSKMSVRLTQIGEKNKISKVDAIANKIVAPLPPEKMIEKMEKGEGGTCLTMQAFFNQNQIPNDDVFFKSLANMDEYSKGDWDYEALKISYKAESINIRNYFKLPADKRSPATLASHRRIAAECKSRLYFLARNPLIKNFMSADSVDKISAKRLTQLKTNFFKLLKDQYLDPSCKNKGDAAPACNKEKIWKKGNNTKYRDSLKKFFSQDDVLLATRVKAETNLVNQYRDVSGKAYNKIEHLLTPDIPSSRHNIENKLTKNLGLSTMECTGQIKDMEACVTAFTQYCPMVDEAIAKYALDGAKTGREEAINRLDELDKEIANATSLDPNINLDYKEQRKLYCERPRRTADGKEVSDYKTFQKKTCPKDMNDDLCFSKFTAKFTRPKISEDPDQDTKDSLHLSQTARKTAKTKLMTKDAAAANAAAGTAAESNDRKAREKRIKALNEHFVKESSLEELNKVASKAVAKDPTAPVKSENTDSASYTSADDPAPPVRTNATNQIISKQQYKEAVKEQKQTEAEIKATTKKLDNTPDVPANKEERDALNEKLDFLTKQLSEQDARLANYRDHLNKKNNNNQDADGSDKENPGVEEEPSPPDLKAKVKTAPGGERTTFENQGDPGSAPSGGDRAAVSGSPSGAGAASLGDSTSGDNKALKGKLKDYGVDAPLDGGHGLVVAADKLETELNIPNTDSVTMEVSNEQYKQFEKNDVKTLEAFYEKRLKGKDKILKITLTESSGKKPPLEFYVIKENGKIIFQPVRKTTLKQLNENLQ